jgi:hypothetical protein
MVRDFGIASMGTENREEPRQLTSQSVHSAELSTHDESVSTRES